MDSQKATSAAGTRTVAMVSTRLGSLKVSSVGTGAPTILWHSLFVDSATWERLTPLLPDRRLLIIDGPSHGGSEPATRRFTREECALAGSDILEHFGITEPVDWIVNAWGGHVGMVLAAANPSLCRSLVTIGTPVNALGLVERPRIAALVGLYRLIGPAGPLVKIVCEALLGPSVSETDPEAYAMVADALSQADRRGMYLAMRSVMLSRPDLSPILSQLTTPTLLIVAANDPLCTPEEAAAAAQLLPRGESAVVPGGGHLAMLQSTLEVAKLVTDFWQRGKESMPPGLVE